MLTRGDIPITPGVYAWYRLGRRQYVGKADSLRARVWGDHLGQSRSIGGSAFRRNVAEHLGFGRAADIKTERRRLTDLELAAIRAWILGCRVAWVECGSSEDAIRSEIALKREFFPPLTRH